jgi:hypothetical protein
MNQEETYNNPFKPCPISKGSFGRSHHGNIKGIEGPMDPTKLGLTHDNLGDKFLLHRVEVSNPSDTFPHYDALFFLEEYPENLRKANHASHPAENLRESPTGHSTTS